MYISSKSEYLPSSSISELFFECTNFHRPQKATLRRLNWLIGQPWRWDVLSERLKEMLLWDNIKSKKNENPLYVAITLKDNSLRINSQSNINYKIYLNFIYEMERVSGSPSSRAQHFANLIKQMVLYRTQWIRDTLLSFLVYNIGLIETLFKVTGRIQPLFSETIICSADYFD